MVVENVWVDAFWPYARFFVVQGGCHGQSGPMVNTSSRLWRETVRKLA